MDAQSPESSLAAEVRGRRPIGVTVSAAYFGIVGAFAMAFGAGMLALGQSFVQLDAVSPGIGSQAGSLFTLVAAVALLLGALWVISAVALVLARPWGRTLGMVMGVVGAAVFGVAAVGALLNLGQSGVVNLVMNAALAAMFAYTVWVLSTAESYFGRR
jgi:hypothetical protein